SPYCSSHPPEGDVDYCKGVLLGNLGICESSRSEPVNMQATWGRTTFLLKRKRHTVELYPINSRVQSDYLARWCDPQLGPRALPKSQEQQLRRYGYALLAVRPSARPR